MNTIWGFDLGVTSVGFAVVRWDEWAAPQSFGEILRLGVRIFPESREERDLNPRNAVRRQKRLMRRQTRRRRWRRVHLRRLLAEAGLLPAHDAAPPGCHDPYALRARGLTDCLEPHELGWALFHLLKRRGFQGSRKGVLENTPKSAAEKDEAKDEQESKNKGELLKAKLNGRKLATYLATIEQPKRRRDNGQGRLAPLWTEDRRRGVGQTRAMVSDELDALWTSQRRFHSALTKELRGNIDDIALAQRPTFFRRRTVGRCELEPAEERALKADWLTQQFEMLQLVNALRLEGGNQRVLGSDERDKAIAYLERTRKPTWTACGRRSGLRMQRGLPMSAARRKRCVATPRRRRCGPPSAATGYNCRKQRVKPLETKLGTSGTGSNTGRPKEGRYWGSATRLESTASERPSPGGPKSSGVYLPARRRHSRQ